MTVWRGAGAVALGVFAIVFGAPSAALAQEGAKPISMPDTGGVGAALYQTKCAVCHDHPAETRAPSRENLAAMTPDKIHQALTTGIMKVQGQGLADDQRAQLIGYLTTKSAVKVDWAKGMMCPADRRTVSLKGDAPIVGFGFDRDNTRSLTARQAGLTKAQLSNMEVAWTIAVPGATSMRAQPAVVGKTVFMPVSDERAVYAFDVSQPSKPCIQWAFKAPGSSPLRTSPAYGVLADGRAVLAIAGQDTVVHLIDAKTGAAIWSKKVGSYAYSMTTGVPTVLKDRVIVPVSQFEISVAGANAQQCCTNHGYVLSLSPKDGSQLWRYDTMEEAKPIKDRGDGKMLYGPSGAPIWNSPAVDEKRRLIYFGTGESNSEPVSKNTDAIIAIGLDDGLEKWSLQATGRDIYVIGCGPNPKPTQLNCSKNTVFRDVDFGASMILAHLRPGVDAVFGGQKSGAIWALEPFTGKLLWRNGLGTGSALGGVHWGIAYADHTVFAPISATGKSLPGETVDPARIKSGMYALDASTGAVKWTFASEPDCAGDRIKRMPRCAALNGLSTAPAVIDGAVVTGALDGWLYVLDAKDGKPLWKFDTAVPFKGINGVDGAGGSIDAVSISAANGLLFVNSGYGQFGGKAGNVLIAFKPKRP
ncbi:PQQ-binding-like beta-propeller repeat protein [soil metagenome]